LRFWDEAHRAGVATVDINLVPVWGVGRRGSEFQGSGFRVQGSGFRSRVQRMVERYRETGVLSAY
jgi:hypothetical protein